MCNTFLILNYIFTTPTRDLHFLRVFTSFEYIIKHAFHKVSHKCIFSLMYARVYINIIKWKPCKLEIRMKCTIFINASLFHAMKITNKSQISVAMNITNVQLILIHGQEWVLQHSKLNRRQYLILNNIYSIK